MAHAAASKAVGDEDSDDALTYLADSLLPLYNEVLPAHGSPCHLFTYNPPSSSTSFQFPNNVEPLILRIPPHEAKLTDQMAHYVWQASIRMANLISTGAIELAGRRVLELGAGAGVPGFVAARVGAEHVTITDYNEPSLIDNLRSNLSSLPESTRKRVSVLGHTWGSPNPALIERGYTDLILADTLWYSASHAALIHSLELYLSRKKEDKARIHIVSGLHSGRETIRSFVRKVEAVGLVVEPGSWREVEWEGRTRLWKDKEDDDEGKEEGITERNRWTVEGRLCWKDDLLE